MRTPPPPRPGGPPMVTPGRRLRTSLMLVSPLRSSSSRPYTIFAAVDRRRVSVSSARVPFTVTCWTLPEVGAGLRLGRGSVAAGPMHASRRAQQSQAGNRDQFSHAYRCYRFPDVAVG